MMRRRLWGPTDGFGYDFPSLFFESPLPFRHLPRSSLRDRFMDDLQITHLKGDLYFVALPAFLPFKHIHVGVNEDKYELIFTYVPTKDSCSFELPDSVDIGRIEAKRCGAEHGILLFLPEKTQLQYDHEEETSYVSDDSLGDSSVVFRSRSSNPDDFEVPPFVQEGAETFEYDFEVLEKSKSTASRSIYTAIHPVTQEPITFQEFEVPSDHDCAFHCIGVSRLEACELLLRNQDSLEIRRLVAPEIEESFIGFQLPREMEEQQIVQDLRKEFFEATEKISEGVRKAKEKLEKLGITCENMDANQIVNKFRWCQSMAILQAVKELMASMSVLQEVERRIQSYCMSKEAFTKFIKCYLSLKGNWAGYLRSVDGKIRTSCLDAIAHLKGLKLFIWIASDDNKLELVHESPGDTEDNMQIINMLHTHKLSHFNLLFNKI